MSKKVFTRPNGRRDVSQFQRRSGHSFSYTFSGMPDDASPSKRGSGSETRREKKPSKMTGFFPMAGRFSLQSRNRKNQPYQIMGKRCRRSDDL